MSKPAYGYVEVPLIAVRAVGAGPAILWAILRCYANRTGSAIVSREDLSKDLGGQSARTITRWIASLELAGYLEVDRIPGGQRNRYRTVLPD